MHLKAKKFCPPNNHALDWNYFKSCTWDVQVLFKSADLDNLLKVFSWKHWKMTWNRQNFPKFSWNYLSKYKSENIWQIFGWKNLKIWEFPYAYQKNVSLISRKYPSFSDFTKIWWQISFFREIATCQLQRTFSVFLQIRQLCKNSAKPVLSFFWSSSLSKFKIKMP